MMVEPFHLVTLKACTITLTHAPHQHVCRNLHDIAMKDKNYRSAHGGGRKVKAAVGGAGIGFGAAAVQPPAFLAASNQAPAPVDPAALPPPPPRPPVAATPAERPLPTAARAAPTPPGPPSQATARSRFDQAPADAPQAATGAVPAVSAPPGFTRAEASPAATLTRAQQSGKQAAAAAPVVHAPRGFVRSTETVGGGSSVPQIVLPSTAAKPAEAPAPWLRKRLQVCHSRLHLYCLRAYFPAGRSSPLLTALRGVGVRADPCVGSLPCYGRAIVLCLLTWVLRLCSGVSPCSTGGRCRVRVAVHVCSVLRGCSVRERVSLVASPVHVRSAAYF